MVLAFGAIVDPTKKLNFLRYAYSRLDLCGYEEKMERVKKRLCMHFLKSIETNVYQLT